MENFLEVIKLISEENKELKFHELMEMLELEITNLKANKDKDYSWMAALLEISKLMEVSDELIHKIEMKFLTYYDEVSKDYKKEINESVN